MATKLYVGNIPYGITNEQLSEIFSQAGSVVSATIITDRTSGRSKGFGFVEMSNEKEAEEAKKLNGKELDSRAIAVADARPQEPREGGGDFRRGGSDRPRRSGGNRY